MARRRQTVMQYFYSLVYIVRSVYFILVLVLPLWGIYFNTRNTGPTIVISNSIGVLKF